MNYNQNGFNPTTTQQKRHFIKYQSAKQVLLSESSSNRSRHKFPPERTLENQTFFSKVETGMVKDGCFWSIKKHKLIQIIQVGSPRVKDDRREENWRRWSKDDDPKGNLDVQRKRETLKREILFLHEMIFQTEEETQKGKNLELKDTVLFT